MTYSRSWPAASLITVHIWLAISEGDFYVMCFQSMFCDKSSMWAEKQKTDCSFKQSVFSELKFITVPTAGILSADPA